MWKVLHEFPPLVYRPFSLYAVRNTEILDTLIIPLNAMVTLLPDDDTSFWTKLARRRLERRHGYRSFKYDRKIFRYIGEDSSRS